MLERADFEAVEAVEQQLDEFIRKRSREKSDEQKIEELWTEQDRRQRERRQRELREEWSEYERHLEHLHMGLALEHRARAEALEEAV